MFSLSDRLLPAASLILLMLLGNPPAAAAQAPAHSGIALSVQATTNGPGVSLHMRPIGRFQLRVMHTYLPVSHAAVVERNDVAGAVDGEAHIGGLALWAEWFPFGNHLHLSAGAMMGSPRVEASVRPTQPYQYSETKVFSPEKMGALRAAASYRRVNPYVGVGWGNTLDDRWSVLIDGGMYVLGRPRVEMSATGLIAPTARQADQLEAAVSSFRYLPYLGVALSYQF